MIDALKEFLNDERYVWICIGIVSLVFAAIMLALIKLIYWAVSSIIRTLRNTLGLDGTGGEMHKTKQDRILSGGYVATIVILAVLVQVSDDFVQLLRFGGMWVLATILFPLIHKQICPLEKKKKLDPRS